MLWQMTLPRHPAMRSGLSLILMALVSCQGKPMRESDLVGNYELTSPYFSGSIELREDHTFVQKFNVLSGKAEEAEGKWDYRPPLKGEINRGTVGVYGAILENAGKLDRKKPDYVISMPV